MTPEQVIAEVTSHLAQRSSPKDPLVPMANFLAMLNGPEKSYSDAEDMLLRRAGGREAIAAHREARLERRAAYERDLVAASEARRSLAAVSREYGFQCERIEYAMYRRLGLRRSVAPMERSRLLEVAQPGMTVAELARAAGYNVGSLRNWTKNGKLEELFVLHRPHNGIYRIRSVRDED